jgi:hypothetical protein
MGHLSEIEITAAPLPVALGKTGLTGECQAAKGRNWNETDPEA